MEISDQINERVKTFYLCANVNLIEIVVPSISLKYSYVIALLKSIYLFLFELKPSFSFFHLQVKLLELITGYIRLEQSILFLNNTRIIRLSYDKTI
jgi:hypothetical protein